MIVGTNRSHHLVKRNAQVLHRLAVAQHVRSGGSGLPCLPPRGALTLPSLEGGEEGYGRGTRMGNGREGAGYGRHCNRSFAILHEARSAQRALPGTAVDRLTPTPSYRSPYRTPYRSLNLF